MPTERTHLALVPPRHIDVQIPIDVEEPPLSPEYLDGLRTLEYGLYP